LRQTPWKPNGALEIGRGRRKERKKEGKTRVKEKQTFHFGEGPITGTEFPTASQSRGADAWGEGGIEKKELN